MSQTDCFSSNPRSNIGIERTNRHNLGTYEKIAWRKWNKYRWGPFFLDQNTSNSFDAAVKFSFVIETRLIVGLQWSIVLLRRTLREQTTQRPSPITTIGHASRTHTHTHIDLLCSSRIDLIHLLRSRSSVSICSSRDEDDDKQRAPLSCLC